MNSTASARRLFSLEFSLEIIGLGFEQQNLTSFLNGVVFILEWFLVPLLPVKGTLLGKDMLAQNVIVWLWISFSAITIIATAYAAQRLLTQQPASMLPDRLQNCLWRVTLSLWIVLITSYITLVEGIFTRH